MVLDVFYIYFIVSSNLFSFPLVLKHDVLFPELSKFLTREYKSISQHLLITCILMYNIKVNVIGNTIFKKPKL